MKLLADTSGSLIFLGVLLLIVYVALLLVALAYNVVRDARRRSTSIPFAIFAFLLAFVPPFLGALIYLVIRPPRTLAEERSLALEQQILEEPPTGTPDTRPCPQFARRCTVCERRLRLGWPVCPYCATEVGAHALPTAPPRAPAPH